MSSPVFVPLNTGDTTDDDGQVIDSFLIETDAPPAPLVEPIDAITLDQPKPATRLITGRQLLDPTWPTPTLLMPADTNRKSLHLKVYSTVATDSAAIAGDAGYAQGSNPVAGRIYPASGGLDLAGHTGSVHAIGLGSAPVYVDWWAVTS